MASVNVVLLAGNLTADVETKDLSSGQLKATLRMAVSDDFTGKDGQKVERTCFVDVEVWGKQAETCRTYLSKGSPVLVEGKLKLDQWQSKEGEKRSKLFVKADRVQFLGAPSRKTEFQDGAEAPSAARPAARPASRPPARQEPPPSDDMSESVPDDNVPF